MLDSLFAEENPAFAIANVIRRLIKIVGPHAESGDERAYGCNSDTLRIEIPAKKPAGTCTRCEEGRGGWQK